MSWCSIQFVNCSKCVHLITVFSWTIFFSVVSSKLLTFCIVFKYNSVSLLNNGCSYFRDSSGAGIASFKWIQELNYHANNNSPPANLAKVLDSLPQIPMNANDQPENHLFLNGSFLGYHQKSMDSNQHHKWSHFLIIFVMVLAYHWHKVSIT